MGDDRSTVNDAEGVRNLGRRNMLSCMRDRISIFVEVVVLMVVVRA